MKKNNFLWVKQPWSAFNCPRRNISSNTYTWSCSDGLKCKAHFVITNSCTKLLVKSNLEHNHAPPRFVICNRVYVICNGKVQRYFIFTALTLVFTVKQLNLFVIYVYYSSIFLINLYTTRVWFGTSYQCHVLLSHIYILILS